jgi:UDP-N-acetylmuramate dehydrogenase
MIDKKDYSLLAHNTFGIDASCRRFLEYSSIEEARLVADILRSGNNPFLIIGGGSNLLLTKDYAGVVVHSAIKGIEAEEQADGTVMLTCGSGEVWDDVVAYSVERGWYGADNLSIIPGEVGASAVQNIGAYGAEVCQIIDKIEAVEIATGDIRIFDVEECGYGYRQSRFKKEWKDRYLMTHVTYRLAKQQPLRLEYGNIKAELERKGINEPTLAQLRQVIIDIRNEKLPDPKVEGNAGSFLMNPVVSKEKYEELAALYPNMPHYTIDAEHEKIPAGWMIDQCGWKGKSLGRAGVHSKQALVLVNRGGATGEEIVQLCETIRKDVCDRFGIDIHPEVNVI